MIRFLCILFLLLAVTAHGQSPNGKARVYDQYGVPQLVDIATQAELDAVAASGIAVPSNRVPYGTGTGTTNEAGFEYDPALNLLTAGAVSFGGGGIFNADGSGRFIFSNVISGEDMMFNFGVGGANTAFLTSSTGVNLWDFGSINPKVQKLFLVDTEGTGAQTVEFYIQSDVASNRRFGFSIPDADTEITFPAAMTVVGTGTTQTLTSKTLTSPILDGVTTNSGGVLETPYDMPALAVNIDRALNRKTISGNVTVTWSGTLVAGKAWRIHMANTAASPAVVTLPAGVLDGGSSASVSSFTVPAAAGGNNGQKSVVCEYNGSNVLIHQGGGGGGAGSLPAAFTGSGTYAYGYTYSGILDDDETIDFSGEASGLWQHHLLNVQGAVRRLEFPTSYRVGDVSGTVDYLDIPIGIGLVSFYFDGTSRFVIPTYFELLSLTTGVVGILPQANGGTGIAALAAGIADFLGTATAANLRTALGADASGTGDLMFTRTGVRRTFYVSAGGFIPRTTNGAARATFETTTNDIMLDSLDFDQTTEEGAGFWYVMPPTWDGGTVTAKFTWTASAGSATETVVWNIAARGFADDAALDQATGTEQAASDALIATGDMHVSATTPSITIGGTAAANTPTYFQVTRDVATDTLAADARLLGVTIEYTESATEPSAQ